MKPGRELDGLVAEKVMNWSNVHQEGNWGWFGRPFGGPRESRIPEYSTDLLEAWQVVESLAPTNLFNLENSGTRWVADFGRALDGTTQAQGETPAHAICLAALAAAERAHDKEK